MFVNFHFDSELELLSNSSFDGKTLEFNLRSPFDTVMECKKSANWGQLIDNLVTLAPIIDYNNQMADLLQTGSTG